MRIENVTIKRRQIILDDKEFRAIDNACCYLKNACGLVTSSMDMDLETAVSALEDILNRIEIEDNYILILEEREKNDA